MVVVLWTVRAFETWDWGRRPRSGASERGQFGNFRAAAFHSHLRGSYVGRERKVVCFINQVL